MTKKQVQKLQNVASKVQSKKVKVIEPESEEESSEDENQVEVSEEEVDEEEEMEIEQDDDQDEDENDEDDDEQEDEEEDEEEENDEEGDEELNLARREDVVDDLFYDLFNLTVANYHPLKVDLPSSSSENSRIEFNTVLQEQTTRAAQLLFAKLSSLPTESSDVGKVTVLPTEFSVLPRTRKIPEPKPETKWEKFAREKGIKNKKRDRMIYDEETGEYKPRYGYKRIKNGLEDMAIVEVKEGSDPYQDPWEKDRNDKKERIKKNQKNQMNNLKHLEKTLKKGNKQYDPAVVPGIPVELNDSLKQKRGKPGLKKALQLVQTSTASMGRYDEMRPGEPARKLVTKTKKNRDNFEPIHSEKQLMKDTLRFVTNKKEKKEKGITNSLAAYEGIIPDAPEFRFKKGKGKGKGKSR